MNPTPSTKPPTSLCRWQLVLLVGAGIALVWAFWPALAAIAGRWSTDAQYSHGYLVPLFALYLLWARRTKADWEKFRPSAYGLLLVLAGLALRFAGIYLYIDWLTAAALVPCLAGLFVLGGGWPALRWAWPAVAFLVFMVPLPYRVEVAMALPLQRVATAASTYALQTLGFLAFAEGNVIRMGTVRIGVVEACSGLSMLLIFFALSTAVVLVVRCPWYEKVLILASAVPIAIASNVIRITVTGILHKTVGAHIADLVFHDLAGWLMMPLGLGFLWCELRLLHWVIRPAAEPPTAAPPIPGRLPGVPGLSPVGAPPAKEKALPPGLIRPGKV